MFNNLQDPLSSLTPNVPINQRSVELLSQHMFAAPAALPPIFLGVRAADEDVLASLPAKRVSPEEVVHAFLFSVAAAIERKESEKVLAEWRRHMLTTIFTVAVYSSEDEMFWASVKLRQDLAAMSSAMVRTTFQLIHEVADVKKKLEESMKSSVSAKTVFDTYKENVVMHTVGEDEFAQSFVDNALSIYNRLFSSKALWPPHGPSLQCLASTADLHSACKGLLYYGMRSLQRLIVMTMLIITTCI